MIINGRRAAAIGGAAIFGLFVVSAVQSGNESENAIAASEKALRPMVLAEQTNPQVKGWRYSSEKDQMRGTLTKIAKLQADDYNPYLSPTLTVWRKEGSKSKGVQLDGTMVVAGVEPSCDSRTRTISVKIDAGRVREMHCEMATSVGIDSSLLDLLKGSKQLTLETDTNLGRKQFTFSTEGLTL